MKEIPVDFPDDYDALYLFTLPATSTQVHVDGAATDQPLATHEPSSESHTTKNKVATPSESTVMTTLRQPDTPAVIPCASTIAVPTAIGNIPSTSCGNSVTASDTESVRNIQQFSSPASEERPTGGSFDGDGPISSGRSGSSQRAQSDLCTSAVTGENTSAYPPRQAGDQAAEAGNPDI